MAEQKSINERLKSLLIIQKDHHQEFNLLIRITLILHQEEMVVIPNQKEMMIIFHQKKILVILHQKDIVEKVKVEEILY